MSHTSFEYGAGGWISRWNEHQKVRRWVLSLSPQLGVVWVTSQATELPAAPLQWGADSLTAFFDTARGNAYATFVHRLTEANDLKTLDRLLHILADSIASAGTVVESMFLLRAHSAFRAAASLAMSGQVPESLAVSRLALECALYGHHLHGKPEKQELWLRRSDNHQSRGAVRAEFSYKNVLRTLERRNQGLANDASLLYERCISFGGHPVEEAFMGAMLERRENGNQVLQQVYLAGDGLALRHCLKTTIQAGICFLQVFQMIWPERVAILGIDRRLARIAARY